MNFRKADPTYVNFKPTTAEDAIDLFYRHKRLGVQPHLWPEVFVKCAADLSDSELGKFEAWLVNPQGEPTGPVLKAVDEDNEKLRKQLLAEATVRDLQRMKIDEEEDIPESYARGECLQDDEKVQPVTEAFAELSTDADFEMVKHG